MKPSGLSTVTRVVLLTAIYFLGGLLGKASSFMSGQVSLVWPPSGIALAAILLFGYKFWPGVATGAVLFTLLNGTPVGFFTVATAIGNTMGAIICAYLLERFVQFQTPMERVRDVSGFILLACLLGTTVNAAFNVVGLCYAQQIPWDELFPSVVEWWVPNAMGALVIAPFILVWGSPTSIHWRPRLILEAAICMAGLIVGTQISFNSWFVHGVENYPLAYLPYPFMAWGALRFGQRGATIGTLLVAVMAISELLNGQGPFIAGAEKTNMILIGCYLGILSVTNMLLAAVAMEREKAVKATIESEQRYRAVVEDQTDLICRFTPNGTLTFVNAAYCRFQGKARDQLIGSNFMPSLAEQDREIPLGWFATLKPSEPTISFDNKLCMENGELVWQQCTIRALFDAREQVREFQAVIQDITRRKQSEEAARLGEERLRAILESMADGVIVADAHGLATSLNPAAELVFQRKAGETAGQPIRNFFDTDSQDRLEAYLNNLQRPGAAKTIELAALRPNGTTVPVELAVKDLFLGAERIFIFSLNDISERKRMEEQFRQSQKMEAIGRLSGGIAHDFNNLMQALLGYSKLLCQRLTVEDPNLDTVEQIQKTVERAQSLTQQLLAFSRKQVVTPKILSINAVVTDMHRLLQRLIGDVIRLKIELGSDAGCVRADRGQLEQVLLNLSINARDAMAAGGTLTIETAKLEFLPGDPRVSENLPPGDYSVLNITDTGCGVPPDVLAHIFEPFFTTKAAGKGTGLGLSIVYSVIKKSGGTITVSSEVEAGTSFSIYLPRVASDVSAEENETASRRSTRGKDTILLVEDEDLVLLMLTELLKAEGYTVLDAHNGAEALAIAARHEKPIHLLITDMSMPEVSGWELSTRLEKQGRNLPVLYMSGYSDEEATQKGPLHNYADFLQKPFQPDAFLVKVRQILDSKRPTEGSQ